MGKYLAFEIIETDVENVLRAEWERVETKNGETFEALAEQIFHDLSEEELSRIERAAIDAGDDIATQIGGAYEEIRLILEAEGWVKPR